MSLVLLVMLVGAAAGCLGALLGIGGGVLLVPVLNAFIGLSFDEAAAVSSMAVLTTASAVATSIETRRLMNGRLATLLLIFSVAGASAGARLIGVFADVTYERIFGVTAVVIAVVMVARLDKRNPTVDAAVDVGPLGGRFFDESRGSMVAYRLYRPAIASIAAFIAGAVASLLGIGGGVLIVPALNAWCGVPMRAAAATSSFMIGITAVPGVAWRWHAGFFNDFHFAAAAALGVLGGYEVGTWLAGRTQVRTLKLTMAVLLFVIAVRYLVV